MARVHRSRQVRPGRLSIYSQGTMRGQPDRLCSARCPEPCCQPTSYPVRRNCVGLRPALLSVALRAM
jgi:hypothetical protein